MSASLANPPSPPPPKKSSAKSFLVSPLGILALSLAFFFAAAWLCLALAFDWIPGYPESAQKSVAIYYQPGPNSTGLVVYLHPPLDSVQARGQSSPLAFQFTNRSASAISVLSAELFFSGGCFRLDPQGPGSAASTSAAHPAGTPPPLLTLDPNQSALLWYRLIPVETSATCPGQSPLVFLYAWQPAAVSSPNSTVQKQVISTGPIRLTTLSGLRWERFFSLLGKIVPLLLLPVLLAIGNYLLQDLQSRRAGDQKKMDDDREREERRREARIATQQKLQEQKLEVWKTMIPSMVQAIRDHYVPIVRVLTILAAEAALAPGKADLNDILACALLFRTKTTHMVDKNGGFYFRNHRGEDLCATLSNALLNRFYTLSGNRLTFLDSAEKLHPVNSITQTRQALRLDSPLPGRFSDFCVFFRQQLTPDNLAALRSHSILLCQILQREINDPFYPFWYETAPQPLKFDELRDSLPKLNLAADEGSEIATELEAYRLSLEARNAVPPTDPDPVPLPNHP